MSRAARLSLGMLVVAVSLVGCTAAPATEETSNGSVGIDSGLENAAGARAALTEESCAAGADGLWGGAGTLTNATDESADFFVRFSLTDPESSSVIDAGSVTYTLGAGESVPVEIAGLDPHDVVHVQCVIRVEVGTK